MQNMTWSPLEIKHVFCKPGLHPGCLRKEGDEKWPSLGKATRLGTRPGGGGDDPASDRHPATWGAARQPRASPRRPVMFCLCRSFNPDCAGMEEEEAGTRWG